MEKFVKNGVKFTSFERDGETYLRTGEPTGKLKFAWAGEVADYYTVVGATSVVSGNLSIDKLYTMWLDQTSFQREVLGIEF